MPKINGFQQILKKKKVDFFISCNLDFSRFCYDMAYFSGYGGVGALVIPKKKKRLFEFVKEKAKQIGMKGKRIGVNKEEFTLLLKDALKKNFKKAILVDLREEIYKLREQKTKKEIG